MLLAALQLSPGPGSTSSLVTCCTAQSKHKSLQYLVRHIVCPSNRHTSCQLPTAREAAFGYEQHNNTACQGMQ
jgi:hypothetical protein